MSKSKAPEAQAPSILEGPIYPGIEGFIETATGDQIDAFFASIKEGLEGLKGPRADNAKKVQKAIDRTEELLHHLVQVREKIEASRK